MLEFCIIIKDKEGKALHIEDNWLESNLYVGMAKANTLVNSILREFPLVEDNYSAIDIQIIRRK